MDISSIRSKRYHLRLKLLRTWVRFRYGIILLVFFAAILVFMRWVLPVVIEPRLKVFFAIDMIDVEGEFQFASRDDIANIIKHYTEKTALYEVDLHGLEAAFKQVPWIETAIADRNWPHELVIDIEETVPIAIWNKQAILSQRGDVFQPQSIEPHQGLPSLIGDESQVGIVTDMYRQASKILRQAQLRLVEIEYTNGVVWRLQVTDKQREDLHFSIVLDGEKSVRRLYRFVEHYPSLSQMTTRPEMVDLRYPTGMAISWADGTK